MSFRYLLSALLAGAFAMGLQVEVARSAGGGGGGGGGGDGPIRPTTQKCPRGQVWDDEENKCVKVKVFNGTQEDRIQLARDKAYGGAYEDTIALLEPVAHRRDPRVLNFLGFAHRKLGLIDTGLAYYRRALAIDPDFTLARSYLGEGYLQIGRLDLARAQLREIAIRCGSSCREYRILETEIDTYLKART